jgi:hypothetical protein
MLGSNGITLTASGTVSPWSERMTRPNLMVG